MRIALIDDETDARATLRSLLETDEPSAIIEEATGVSEGLALIRNQKPEIVFLDVMMKDGTGFDLLKQLPAINFKLIIVSGHHDFALQAFRFSAIDYLVKPVDVDELRQTLTRVRSLAVQPWHEMMEVLKQNVHAAQTNERKIVLKDMDAVYVVAVNSIIRCEASNNYTTIHLTDQPPILVSRPLKEYDELLTPMKFIRVHQSHLINLNHLQQFNKREGGNVKMKDGSEVPVSTRKREALLQELSRM
jgi:two-component system, LytTR family, response regulator